MSLDCVSGRNYFIKARPDLLIFTDDGSLSIMDWKRTAKTDLLSIENQMRFLNYKLQAALYTLISTVVFEQKVQSFMFNLLLGDGGLGVISYRVDLDDPEFWATQLTDRDQDRFVNNFKELKELEENKTVCLKF